MKFSYQFSNLIGTVYRKGNLIFSSDGNSVLCPVGNKISIFDLRNNRSHTLPVEARFNYTTLALSPNGLILIAAEEDGEVHIINLNFKNVIYRKRFNRPIKSIRFSPDGKHFALTKENAVFVYAAPGSSRRIFDPFVMEKVFHASYDDTSCLDWSFDSRVIVVGSRDMITRVYGLMKFKNLREYSLGSNKDTVVGVFFEENSLDLHTVGRDGIVCSWECSVDPDGLIPVRDIYKKEPKKEKEEEEEDDIPLTQEEIEEKEKQGEEDEKVEKVFYTRRLKVFMDTHFETRHVTVTAAEYHKKTRIMVVAFATGDFLLLDMNDKGALVHSLNISKQIVTSVAMNPSGDWIALGVSSLGQLLVWEWQSETYVLKQQGHFNNMRVVMYSPDGLNLASGGEDGKVKLWSTQSSFCFVTFSEHNGPVTGLAFTQSGKAILSSSLDGTVRAFDLTRYRNFKTMTSPKPTQFSCLSVDSAGELVVAGGQDSHDIYLWSLQTGRLLEVLAGHTGPVVSLDFSKEPGSTMLVSTGWDSSVKVWDAIANTTAKESIALLSDGLFVTFRPDGKQIAVATMDGQIQMFEPNTGKQQGSISGRPDLGAGRADADKITAKKNLESKCFTTLCYSSDGQYILAGGQSKNVCIYSIEEEILVKKFEITQNRSFDAMDETVNRRKMAENGVNLALVEEREDRESEKGVSIQLPGTRRGDKSTRVFRPEVNVTSLHFSPTGRSWAAGSSEGLLIYSLDNDLLFDPFYLDVSSTPAAVKQKLKEKEYTAALMMAMRLNINLLKQEVIETIPLDAVKVVISDLGQIYVEGVLKFLAEILEASPHVGLYAKWASLLVAHHGQKLKTRAPQIMSILNSLQRSLTTHHTNLSKVCSHNEYMLKYLQTQSSLHKMHQEVAKKEEPEDVEMNNIVQSDAESEEHIDDLFHDIEAEP
ncbi:periodic tryptophan protein 2 homolog [Macrobrachium rosenbergii]|uniref:periodic tryptophan protein 2 homolog n=1 Tax=Macrobrachium rosenbergii TaxID=79674 RepID=UPI0034D68DBE